MGSRGASARFAHPDHRGCGRECCKSIANQAATFSAAPAAIEQVPPSPVLSLVQQPILSVIALTRFYGVGVEEVD